MRFKASSQRIRACAPWRVRLLLLAFHLLSARCNDRSYLDDSALTHCSLILDGWSEIRVVYGLGGQERVVGEVVERARLLLSLVVDAGGLTGKYCDFR